MTVTPLKLFSEIKPDLESTFQCNPAPGLELMDTSAPFITKVSADSNTLCLFFNEEIELTSAIDPENYVLSDEHGQTVMPWAVKADTLNSVKLIFNKLFNTGSYQLICRKISDTNGNTILNYKIGFDYGTKQVIPVFGLLITEIMADPSPSIGLPSFEYIEIYNPGEQTIDLADVQLQFESTSYSLDTSILLLSPKSYLILCERNAAEEFKKLGRTHQLRKWPAIRNTTGIVSLTQNDKIIHSIQYDDSWYNDNQKKNGGWSLEMINTNNVCDLMPNWKASVATKGGTPGNINSVNDNNYSIPLSIDSFQVIDEYRIRFKLNKDLSNWTSEAITITPPLSIQFNSNPIIANWIELQFGSPLQSGIIYHLELSLKTCNKEQELSFTNTSFIKKETIDYQDLVINEVLFNPIGSGSDYVELFNRSRKVISTEGCTWSNEYNGQKRRITSRRWILPGEYIVFTMDTNYIFNTYHKVNRTALIEQLLPALANEAGQLTLYSPEGKTIDSMHYREDLHSAFLTNVEGVSLERIKTDPSGGSENWHSASGSDNYGTPTRMNSSTTGIVQTEFFKLNQKIFSPDYDGYQDELRIIYSLPAKDFLAKVFVYDDHGRLIRRLVDNSVLTRQGSMEWNGLNESNQNCKSGIYILDIEALGLDGKKIKSRLTAVLAIKN